MNNYANNNINQTLQNLFSLRNAGHSPQQIMQMLIQQNPQMQQMLVTLQNMAQGKNPKEFLTQLARQNGVNEQNMGMIMQLFGG